MKQLKVFENRDAMDTYLDGGVVNSNEILYEKDTETLIMGTNNDGTHYEMKEFGVGGGGDISNWVSEDPSGEIVIPKGVDTVRVHAFSYNDGITSVDLSDVTVVKGAAFTFDANITELKGDKVIEVDQQAFEFCSALKSIDLPNLEKTGYASFHYCTAVEYINTPNLKRVGNVVFESCNLVTDLYLPKVTYVSSFGFSGMEGLEVVDFGNEMTSVPTAGDGSIFSRCSALTAIVVPDALYDDWKTATYWKNYASKMVKYSEYHNETT